MASYDNLLAEQPWSFRPAFSDAWNISDLFTMENDALTKALQSSIAGDVFSAEMLPYTLYTKADASATPSHTPTVSGVSSENEALASSSKQQRRSAALAAPSGRIAKRKPRPSKRAATTTFIATDPENFMQMVQQVTGVRIDGGGGVSASARLASVAVLKPEPRRAADGLMPTLDTSAFLLDSLASSVLSKPSAAAPEHYFDSFCSFPTLESWNV